MSKLFGFCFEQVAHSADGFFGVHRARRVVGGVDDDGFGACGDSFFKRVKVGLEILFVERHDYGCSACRFDKHRIFGEKRRKQNEFVRTFVQRVEGYRKGSRRSAGHINEVGGDVRTETAVYAVGDCFSDCGVALRGSVSVKYGAVGHGHEVEHGFFHAFGRGYVGIAEGKVVNFVGADFRHTFFTEFEQFPDYGTVTAELIHFAVVHKTSECAKARVSND